MTIRYFGLRNSTLCVVSPKRIALKQANISFQDIDGTLPPCRSHCPPSHSPCLPPTPRASLHSLSISSFFLSPSSDRHTCRPETCWCSSLSRSDSTCMEITSVNDQIFLALFVFHVSTKNTLPYLHESV